MDITERIHLDERDYFGFPLCEQDLLLEDFDQWEEISELVEAAKRGEFDKLPPALALYDADDSWVRGKVYVMLLGDAGPDALVERIHQYLLAGLPVDYSWDFLRLLFHWGRLDVVPTLVQAWRAAPTAQDAASIPGWLSLLLEESPGPIERALRKPSEREADNYAELVLARHAELVAKLGERAFVFRGRLLDVAWIAQCGLAELATLQQGMLDVYIRHKFETMTGIDCSHFYEGINRRLAAAATFEAFLAGPERHAFIPGQRYFFGHRVPAGDPEGAAQWPPR